MKVKPPPIVLNVYRDLRDRRLLPIAVALLVAIIAVPFLLGGDDPAAPVVSAQAEDSAQADEGVDQIDPVVTADVPGLRNFHERLDRYKSRDPFKQQLAAKPAGEEAGGQGGSSGGGLPTQSTSSSSTSSTDSTTSSTDSGTEQPTTTPTTQPGDSSGGGGSSGGGAELISYTLDVRVGKVGDTRVEKDVKPFSLLPDKKHAVVQYVNSDTHGTEAGFVVNPAAAAVKGDGHCSKSRSRCHFLLLEPGEEMYFLLGDGDTYRLELKSINEHREPYEPKADPAKGSGRASFSSFIGG